MNTESPAMTIWLAAQRQRDEIARARSRGLAGRIRRRIQTSS